MAFKKKYCRKGKGRKTHKKRGGSFKSVLGQIGTTLLNVAPLVLSALGRRRRHRRSILGRGVPVTSGQYPIA